MTVGIASKEWRDNLKREVVIPELMNSLPLTKYYQIADQVACQAEEQDLANLYAHAYISYQRYLGLALEVIPKHNYYKHNFQLERNALRVRRDEILNKLSLLVSRMDEVAQKHKDELTRQEQIRRAAEEERIRKEREKIDQDRKRAAEAIEAAAAAAEVAIQLPDPSKRHEVEGDTIPHINEPLDLPQVPVTRKGTTSPLELSITVEPSAPPYNPSDNIPAAAHHASENTVPIVTVDMTPEDPVPFTADSTSSELESLSNPGISSERTAFTPMEPVNTYPIIGRPSYMPEGPAPPPRPRPAPIIPSSPPPSSIPTSVPPPSSAPPCYSDFVPKDSMFHMSSAVEKVKVTRQWDKLLHQNQAKIDYLQTFQGRNHFGHMDSTNGCTVISPLVAYRHITWPSSRLPNSHIEHVIDVDCPPILNQIRAKHSLPNGSFIVPADVHDFLFDRGILKDLVNDVCGGNILEDEHMNNWIETFEAVPPGKKAGAAFFFCEHVTAVLKNTDGTYELVDSMPHQPVGLGCRFICSSAAVLKICLQWYSYSKLIGNKLDYIEKNSWSDIMAELDPRTFQAHVWHRRE